jgi:hypothetical protein
MRTIGRYALGVLDALAFTVGVVVLLGWVAAAFTAETWPVRILVGAMAVGLGSMLVGVARTWQRPRWLRRVRVRA